MDKVFERISILGVIAIYILINMILSFAVEMTYLSGSSIITSNLLIILSQIMIGIYIMYKLKVNGFSLKNAIIDFKRKPKLKDGVIILVLHGVLAISAAIGVAYIVSRIDPELTIKMMNERIMDDDGSLMDKIYNIISAVILAPIVEELIFRGVMFNRIKMKWGVTKAIIISSVLFGILHMNLAIAGAVLFGVMMCIVYMKTHNILVTMSIHFVNNLTGIFGSFGGNQDVSLSDIQEVLSLGKGAIIITCIFSIISIYYIVKNWPSKNYA